MSKGKQLFALMGSLFAKSFPAISENLSVEELDTFAEETEELNARLTAQTDGNGAVLADLEIAQKALAEMTTKHEKAASDLSAATTKITDLEGKLTAAEGEAKLYKDHYEKAAGAGAELPGEDASSRGGEMADYNAYALEVWRANNKR